jgi:hypothetical protein
MPVNKHDFAKAVEHARAYKDQISKVADAFGLNKKYAQRLARDLCGPADKKKVPGYISLKRYYRKKGKTPPTLSEYLDKKSKKKVAVELNNDGDSVTDE